MEQEKFSPLDVIQEMIDKTKKNYGDNGFLYLFWGYLVFIAALAHFILMKLAYVQSFLPWAILMPFGGIVMVIWTIRQEKREKIVKTYVDEWMKYIWLSFGAALAIVLLRMPLLQLYTYPLVMMIYGIPTFITGGIFKFKPLIIGGICCWIFAWISFQMSFDNQLLWLMASLVAAYIIPGHILQYQFKK